MKPRPRTILKKFIAMSAFISSGISTVVAQDGPLGQFDGHGDIGNPKLAGSASYDPASQAYTISGAGINMWFTNDQCISSGRK